MMRDHALRLIQLGMLVAIGAVGAGCSTAKTTNLSTSGSPSIGKFDNILIQREIENGKTNYTISYENGRYGFGIDDHQLMVIIHNKEMVETMYLKLDATNDTIYRTVMDLPDGSRIIGNADGIPVKKVSPKLVPSYFKGGEFVPATNAVNKPSKN